MGNFQENNFFKFCLLILEREGGRDMEQERESKGETLICLSTY